MNFEFWILDFLLFASSTYIRTMYSSGSVIVAAEVPTCGRTSVIANLNAVSLVGFQMITVGKSLALSERK